MGLMPAWVSLFPAQSSLECHLHSQCTRQTDEPLMMKDDEHGLPQVQPGKITPDGVTWQTTTTTVTWTGDGWKKDVGPGSSDGRAPDA